MNTPNAFYTTETAGDEPCSTGLKQNVAAILAYIFGIVFVFIESQNRFVRYCAVQSLFLWAGWMLLFIALTILSAFPIIGLIFELLRALVSLAALVAISLLAYAGNKGIKVRLPFISKYAEDWSAPDE